MTEEKKLVKIVFDAKRQMEEAARAPLPETYYLHLTEVYANELGVKKGDVVGTFAGRPVEVALIVPYPIINIDELDQDMKTFGEYEKFFVHPAVPLGKGTPVHIKD